MPRSATEKKKYTTISIPQPLMDRVDDYLKAPDCHYKNRTDFVLTAIREKLQRLGLLKG